MSRLVPSERRKYEALLSKMFEVAVNSPVKCSIVDKQLRKFEFIGGADSPKKFSIMHLQSLKSKNRLNEHRKLVADILVKFGSKRKAAKVLGVPRTTFIRLCTPKVKKVTNRTLRFKERKGDLENWFLRDDISTGLPGAKLGKRRFLFTSLVENYKMYRLHCKELNKKPMPFSTYCKFHPKDVYSFTKTPKRQCVCEICDNFMKEKSSLVSHKVLGLKGLNIKDLVFKSICVADDNDITDVINQNQFGRIDCIRRQCIQCGTHKFREEILKLNEGIESDAKKITWPQWQYVTKEGTEQKRLDVVNVEGTKMELLESFLSHLQTIALHLFNANWHRAQFQYILQNLKEGYLLQVMDFAQNYLNRFQDEPQAVHWAHEQTSMHPIINYYRCPVDGKIMKDEHMMITADLKHDKYVVQKFEEISLSHLKSNGIDPKFIIQFCDNCSSQYKSFGPFEFISKSSVPKMRCYYGARHAKSPADGFIGRCKQTVTIGIDARHVVIRNAEECHAFLQQKLTNDDFAKCNHSLQHFFLVENIDRSEPLVGIRLGGTMSFQCVRNTGTEFIVEARTVACLCNACLTGDKGNLYSCPNRNYTNDWKQYSLMTGREVKKQDQLVDNTMWSSATSVPSVTMRTQRTQRTKGKGKARSGREPVVSVPPRVAVNPMWEALMVSVEGEEMNFDTVLAVFKNNQVLNVENIDSQVNNKENHHEVDPVALAEIAEDSIMDLVGFHPVITDTDGNCFPRAVSTAICGCEDLHTEIRMCIIIEGIRNINTYLNPSYLEVGSRKVYKKSPLSCIYAQYSPTDQEWPSVKGLTNIQRDMVLRRVAIKNYREDITKM